MTLNLYQQRIVDEFAKWHAALVEARKGTEDARHRFSTTESDEEICDLEKTILNYPKKTWKGVTGSGDHVDRFGPDGTSIPHVCFKVPTGGGKTRMAAAAITFIRKRRGLVLWMVPTKAIRDQTISILKDKSKPIRRMLDGTSGNRVVIKYKTDKAKRPVSLSRVDVEDHLCIIVIMMQSANSRDSDRRLIHRNSDQCGDFIPSDGPGLRKLGADHPYLKTDEDGGVPRSSLANVFRLLKPIVILDEAHKASASKFPEWAGFVSDLGPELILELSATPNPKQSNILSEATTSDLINESMIKKHINLNPSQLDWKGTLQSAVKDLKRLEKKCEGEYIRPIMVVRARYTGDDQREKDIHSEDVRSFLTGALGIPTDQVAVKSAKKDELKDTNLMSHTSQIRYIITKEALKEGWDCPFAYMLVVLDRMTSRKSITQQLGRIMRQPYARYTGVEDLDRCYVHYMAERDDDDSIMQTTKQLMRGLKSEGFDMRGRMVLNGEGDRPDSISTVRSRSRDNAGVRVCLPMVSHMEDGDWVELDYRRHILSEIDLERISIPYEDGASLDSVERRVSSRIDIREYKAVLVREEVPGEPPRLTAWTGNVSEWVPNAWQAARMVREFWDSSGLDAYTVAANEEVLLGMFCRCIKIRVVSEAEKIFKEKLEKRVIRFSLEAPSSAFRLAETYEVASRGVTPLSRDDGHPFQANLFDPVLNEDYDSNDERNWAKYLDEAEAIKWWHRVAARNRNEYYLRGWQKDRIYPDFVALFDGDKNTSILRIYEIKGDHLDNPDTEYKRDVFAELQKSFNAGMMKVKDGSMQGEFQIIFGDEIKAKRPKPGGKKPARRSR